MATKHVRASRSVGQMVTSGIVSVPLALAAVYLTFFLALLTPVFQRHFIFLHAVRYPLYPDFNDPSRYGLAPFKARNVYLTPTDKPTSGSGAEQRRLGAWHILPESYYQSEIRALRRTQQTNMNGFDNAVYEKALKELPTIIYLHGNAMSRAAPFRIAAYSALTSRIEANVVAIDYRGFGDSDGTPSEAGLVHDAYIAYRWILSHHDSTHRPSVTVFGQSLGTGIAALLASAVQNANDDAVPALNNIVLMAPYSNLRGLVRDYRIGGVLPILAPLRGIPFHDYLLTRFMNTHLDTLKTLPKLLSGPETIRHSKTNIVLLHAVDDPIIPISHSYTLFDTALEGSPSQSTVHERSIDQFAKLRRFTAASSNQLHETVVTLIETQYGGHNQLSEGALDLVRLACGLPSAFTRE